MSVLSVYMTSRTNKIVAYKQRSHRFFKARARRAFCDSWRPKQGSSKSFTDIRKYWQRCYYLLLVRVMVLVMVFTDYIHGLHRLHELHGLHGLH